MVDKSYKFMIYQRSNKSVVNIGGRVVDVDELSINVPTWAEYNISGVAKFVIAGNGRARFEETRTGNTTYRKCVIEGE